MNAQPRQLIDALIDRVHTDWPTMAFVLRLPSGEQVMLPPHHEGAAECASGHTGYYADRILPFCQAHPTPRHGGRCWATPLTSKDDPPTIPAYITDRRFGILTAPNVNAAADSTPAPSATPNQPDNNHHHPWTPMTNPETAMAAGVQ